MMQLRSMTSPLAPLQMRGELTCEMRGELAPEMREELAPEMREELAPEMREELAPEIAKGLSVLPPSPSGEGSGVRFNNKKKRILTGVESFQEIIEDDYFYIDKTLFIKELFESKGKVTLITRPRRFGKTLNMSMLEHFFDSGMDSRSLFDGLKIMEHSDIIEKHLNKYPVIFMTLRSIEEESYENALEKINDLISELYRQHKYILERDELDDIDKEIFLLFRRGKSSETKLKSALKFLTSCLYDYHKKKVIVLLDEYDTPIDNSVRNGYYPQMINFMRGFFGEVFKSNNYLEFGVLTGVQRISRESLLSSFNNPKVCGIMNNDFSTCFGFTEDEIKDTCVIYEKTDKYEDIKSWYDGYRIGGTDMYNPWSIIQYFDRGKFDNYWVNVGGMDILADIFFKGTKTLKDKMAALLTNKPVLMTYDEHIRYPIVYESDDVFWSMLLNTGYIKPCAGSTDEGCFYAELVNREVKNIFKRCIDLWFKRQERSINNTIQKFVNCLLTGDKDGVSETLNEDLLNNPSCHDFKEENSYHMFIFGILLAVSGEYTVWSNPESGKGRSDCLIKPTNKDRYAAVIEFKHQSEDSKDLLADAQKGLVQIEEKSYIHSLKREGYHRIYKYGIAFLKKNCEVAMSHL